MKTKLLFQKSIIALIAVLILSISAARVKSQVIVKLQYPPPGQVDIENLWKIQTLTNTTSDNYTVYLRGTVNNSDNGDIVWSGSSASFELEANYSGPVIPSSLEPVTGEFNNKYENAKEIALRTGSLPAGNYTLCVYVIDVKMEQELGSDCIQVNVAHPSPPELISPGDGAIVEDEYPVFTWTPPMPIPPGKTIIYALKIVEVMDGQTPEEAMQSNPAFFENKNIQTTSYQYPVSAGIFYVLKPRDPYAGPRYAWQVTALDFLDPNLASGLKSEVRSFKYGKTITKIIPPKILFPKDGQNVPTTLPTFIWTVPKNTSQDEKIKYIFKIFGDVNKKHNEKLKLKKPLFEVEQLTDTIFHYPKYAPSLTWGSTYSWSVAADINGTLYDPSSTVSIDSVEYDLGDAPDPTYPTNPLLGNAAIHEWRYHDASGWHDIPDVEQAWLGPFPNDYDPSAPTVDCDMFCTRSITFEPAPHRVDPLDDGVYLFAPSHHYCCDSLLDSIDIMVQVNPVMISSNTNLYFVGWSDWNANGGWEANPLISGEGIRWLGATPLAPTGISPPIIIDPPLNRIIEINPYRDDWGQVPTCCVIYRLYFIGGSGSPCDRDDFWMRFRLFVNEYPSLLQSYIGYSRSGEVEDYQIVCDTMPNKKYDFGDAPDEFDYPGFHYCSHLTAPCTSGGGRHKDFSQEWLGNITVADKCESCPGPSATEESDANTVDLDVFDNGVDFSGFHMPYNSCDTESVIVEINTSGDPTRYTGSRSLHLHAWFDWNKDGDWDDTYSNCSNPADEHIFWLMAESICDGSVTSINDYDFRIRPSDWPGFPNKKCNIYRLKFLAGNKEGNPVTDTVWCRFRLSYDDNGIGTNVASNYFGPVQYGEVEDYALYSENNSVPPSPPKEKIKKEFNGSYHIKVNPDVSNAKIVEIPTRIKLKPLKSGNNSENSPEEFYSCNEMHAGWNQVSLPFVYVNSLDDPTEFLSINLMELFPEPTYSPSDYHPVGRVSNIYTLIPGLPYRYQNATLWRYPEGLFSTFSIGFWVAFNGDVTLSYPESITRGDRTWYLAGVVEWPYHSGVIIRGWNMKGSVMDSDGGCDPIDFSDPTVSNPGLIETDMTYWYNPETGIYERSTEIEPFKSYWVMDRILPAGFLSLP